MKLLKDKFREAVGVLRDRFNDPKCATYLFNNPNHGKKAVPSDGFPHYAAQVWNTIKTNKDLNLPSQREMLATYRCDEISAVAFNTFVKDATPLRERTAAAFVPTFGSEAATLLAAAMDTFEKVGGRYNADVVAVKRAALKKRVCDELFVWFGKSQMKHAITMTVNKFKADLQKGMEHAAPRGSSRLLASLQAAQHNHRTALRYPPFAVAPLRHSIRRKDR
jgi:protein SEY1